VEDMLTNCKKDHLVLLELEAADHTIRGVSLMVGLRRPHEMVSSELRV
jgi:hypothetical protein